MNTDVYNIYILGQKTEPIKPILFGSVLSVLKKIIFKFLFYYSFPWMDSNTMDVDRVLTALAEFEHSQSLMAFFQFAKKKKKKKKKRVS